MRSHRNAARGATRLARVAAGLLVGVLLLCCCGALAGSGHPWITVEPAAPVEGETIRLRIEVPQSVPYVPPIVQIEGNVVRVQVVTPDFGGPQYPARTEFRTVGVLAVGTYRFDYFDCVGLPPPPVPACSFAGSETVVVSPAPSPTPVPAAGLPALLALGSLLAALGARTAGRRA